MLYTALNTSQYDALADQKNKFEKVLEVLSAKYKIFSDEKSEENKAALSESHEKAQKAASVLFERIEIISAEVRVKAPQSFSQFREIYLKDFQSLINILTHFMELSKIIAGQLGIAPRVPIDKEFEQAFLFCALSLSLEEREEIRSRLSLLGCPIWDLAMLKELVDSMANNTIIVPASVKLDNSKYNLFAKYFIDDEVPTILVIGSGGAVSVTKSGLPDGMPTWRQFIDEIVPETARIQGWTPKKLKDAQKNAFKNPLEQLSLCQTEIAAPGYWDEVLDRLVTWPAVAGKITNVSLYNNLHLLPFRVRMTTNYDSLYERINNVHIVNFHNLEKAVIRWSKSEWSTRIAKIHGCVDSADDLIVTETDYNKRYSDDDWVKMFRDIFRNYNVLFIGFGLNDPYFKFAFRKVIPPSGVAGRHYFIFSDEQDEDKKRFFLNEYRLELITYPKGQHQYQAYYIQDLVRRYRSKLSSKPLSIVGLP